MSVKSKGVSAQAKHRRNSKLRGWATAEALAEWDKFVDDLPSEMQRRKNMKGRPMDRPKSYLKIQVYEFVLKFRRENKLKFLREFIEELCGRYTPRSPQFNDNPFHWVLSGLKVSNGDLDRREVMRFGRELLYADRHQVPSYLLIGFLYQCGSSDVICKKATNPSKLEDWFERPTGEAETADE